MNPKSITLKREIMVVSKVKATIKEIADFHTSSEVLETLNAHNHTLIVMAVESARADGRKTVMHRDMRVAIDKFTSIMGEPK